MAPPPILNTQYLVFTGYVGPDQPNVTQTWLFPPAAAFNQATPATAFPVPFLYIGTGNQPASQPLVTNDDFVIDMVVNGGINPPGQKDVNITLQLTGKNAWNTAPAARAALRQNFLSCLE